ncbi:MAG: dTDP-glucose 4,6-dehydratase [Bacteroidales bacterium]|nr:dTDP-glucose 4,6-dehydratase [Bacteroidales bacterium]
MDKTILITGGAGFIGSHLVRRFVKLYPNYLIVNADKLTYAGNLNNLKEIENSENYRFELIDIVEKDEIKTLFEKYSFDSVIHLAAESHVDRSISSPDEFIYTNIIGTVNLLNAARQSWNTYDNKLFYHISTDEVYGSLGETGLFTESTAYDPRSPYSASKASSDHLVRAWHATFGLPIIISNCSNNYGPNQFPEKLIPLAINNIKNNKPVPVYGSGENIRDWLYVEDHAAAIDLLFHKGRNGETYNIGGNNELKNIDLLLTLCSSMDQKLNRKKGESKKLLTFVKDRAGHDMRYAIDCSKIHNELGWQPLNNFESGLQLTIDWYLSNQDWLDNIISGDYEKYYVEQYLNR